MRRFSVFLIQACVCLLGSNIALTQAAQGSNARTSLSSALISSANGAGAAAALSMSDLRAKLTAARTLLQSEQAGSSAKVVSLAVLDSSTSEIDSVSLNKDSFLTKGADLAIKSQRGDSLRLKIVRPNGVNTAVRVTNVNTGQSLLPLMVRYPIERNGASAETAFYVSAHPELISSEVIAAGRDYLTTMLNQAAASLAENSVSISPDLVTVAEHLVVVEHTDHRRFLNEDRGAIYPDILSLYALNQGDTFRYSVSSAGAGGMIQMIPQTYEGIRQHHQSVDLEPDFVKGMQDHANALKAMLLYINDTWNYLQKNQEIQDALRSGSATKAELLAAGYNSNPMRLPQYLKNGGSGWRTLIPAETQMYLAIYSSVDSNVDFATPPTTIAGATNTPVGGSFGTSTTIVKSTSAALMSWIGRQLVVDSAALTHLLL